jgi:hypothetical protein
MQTATPGGGVADDRTTLLPYGHSRSETKEATTVLTTTRS